MQQVARTRILLFIASLLIVPTFTYLVILFAKGYRPDFKAQKLQPTGLLAIRSLPDSAQVYVDGSLRGATDTTVNLPPGDYDVEAKKEGYHPWSKHLHIQAEIVTSSTAWLFPTVPSLKAITSTGAANPVVSPQGNTIVFAGTGASQNKLFSLDLSESPLGLLNKEVRQIASSPVINFAASALHWSPDSRQLLINASTSAYLLDLSSQQITDVSVTLPNLISSWNSLHDLQEKQKFATLPPLAQSILATSAADLVWSPKENRVLYTATASAILPDNIIRPLPGSSTQKQERALVPGHVYVYDLEEDRNFYITSMPVVAPSPSPKPKKGAASVPASPAISYPSYTHKSGLLWFPSSAHLVKVSPSEVSVFEYDGQNPTAIYAGPMEGSIAIPYPSGKQLLILTNLTPAITSSPNLYAVSLR